MGFNLIKMFTPPKSKSPWEAMTSGSTGGWASGLKSLGPILTAAAGAVPGIGPFLSTAMGAAGMTNIGGFQGTDYGFGKGIMDMLGGGLMGWGAGGLGKGIAQGVQSAWGSSGPALNNLVSGFSKGLLNYGNSTLAPFGMASTKGASAGLYNAMNTYLPSANNVLFGSSSAMGPTVPGALSFAPTINPMMTGAGSSMLSGINFGSNVTGASNWLSDPKMLGGLAMLASSAIPSTPKYSGDPMIGELTSRLLGGKGISDVGAMSREKLMQLMQGNLETVPNDYYNAATRRIDEAYSQAEDDLVKRYKHYGGEDSTEFKSQLRSLREDQAREKAAIGAELEYSNYQNQMNRLYDAIKTGLGIDDNVMQELLGLTGMSMEEAGLKYGAEVADVESLRNMLGAGGSMMLQGAINQQTNTNQLNAMAAMNKYQTDMYSKIYGNAMLGGK